MQWINYDKSITYVPVARKRSVKANLSPGEIALRITVSLRSIRVATLPSSFSNVVAFILTKLQ